MIQDLFSIPKEHLFDELKRNNFSEDQIDIFLKLKIDIIKLSSDYPELYSVLQKVSQEFDIDPVNMLHYLKEKKNTHKVFHRNADLRKYAVGRTNYDLKEFLEMFNMHPINQEEHVLLQPVFCKICQIIKTEDF